MWENFMMALEISWKGMAGIFAASLVIMLAVMAMSLLGKKDQKKEEKEQ